MTDAPDNELLAQFVRNDSESAFAVLVQRHIGLVHSVALRSTSNPQHAQDVTQAVFIILARKAESLGRKTVLPGWLYHTARLTAANFQRSEVRRFRREQEAFMQSTLEETTPEAAWRELAPLLDDAMARLSATERNALVLRYFQNKSLPEVGAALGIGERAAQKRVSRTLEKLRKIFTNRGVRLGATVIAGAISANSVQAAPPGLAASMVSAALKGAAVTVASASLVQATIQALAWARYKSWLGYGAAALLAGSAIIVVLPKVTPNPPALFASQAAAAVPVLREPLADTMKFTLQTPPGGLAIQPNGKIVVGTTLFGSFLDEKSGALGFYTRGAIRLNPDGSLDRSFLVDAGRHDSAAQMAHVEVSIKGRILVSGAFDAVDGQSRPGYAMLLPDGKVDESFEPWRGSTNVPQRTFLPGGTVPAIGLPDGSVAVMSASIEGARADYPLTVYRLDASGKWIPPSTNILASEFSRPSGLMLTLGPLGFWARKTVNWTRDTPADRRPPFQANGPPSDLPAGAPVADLPFERWNETPTAVDAAKVFQGLFEEIPMELCRYAVRLPDGGVIMAVRDKVDDGSMSGPGRFMRFDKNWKPDFSFTNQFEGDLRSCLTLKRQKDGKLLVGGLIGKMNGEDFPGVVRLHENGEIDRSFHCETTNSAEGRVMDVAIQEDGRIVICGFFSTVNGAEVPHLARLNPDGSLDQTFRTSFMTLEQFNRDRFGKMRRVPVTRLAENPEPSSPTKPAANDPAALPQTILITSMRLESGVAVIQFTGVAHQEYILQASALLDSTGWVNISTNQATANGAGMFRDAEANKYPMRFYRIASP
ncbi:MAG: hypothetical protein JWR69_3593 [Pedosphaera sp.]|nr:hypothetical protein [Pedosphaera sp.]